MYCKSCGAEIKATSKFCPSCGTTIKNEDPTPRFARPPQKYQGPKKLYRSRKDRVVAGVCGGLGDYFDVDPTIIRFLWAFSILVMGTGLLAYIIAIVVIPESPLDPWAEPDE